MLAAHGKGWRCWISISLGSTGSWWFVVVAFKPVSVEVSCSFSAGEGLAATTFADDLGGEDERNSANGGASEVPLWLRVPGNRGRKVPPMASVDTRGQKPPFFASPQYASVLEPGQNIINNRGQKPLLH
ncbi:hypothetical protein DEO72_LG5g480 [Vigna unguiculata]|uniref:Uncharacterized protein n=1 Tax=Vigna unguiculata TaxID=3917 RepID=A0A4D6LVP5_VIGUN|nr:hypothetical protein DEO72_LG5g480 [Vigna unguiculata]